MLWNQPSAMAMVLTLATLICGVLSTVSTLKQQSPSSNPVWLIDIVPLATNTGTDNATWVDQVQYGQSNIGLSTNIPTAEGKLFTNTLFIDKITAGNIRLYSKSGEPLLTLSSQTIGTKFGFVKCLSTKCHIVTSTFKSTTAQDNLWIQPLDIRDEVFAAQEPNKTLTDRAYLAVVDEPGMDYFFTMGTLRLYKYSLTDGIIQQSSQVGGASFDLGFIISMSNPSRMLVSYPNQAIVVVMDKLKLQTYVYQQNLDCGYAAILDSVTSKQIYSLANPTEFFNFVQKTSIPDSGSLTIEAKTVELPFYFGLLVQIPKTGHLIVVGQHNSVDTSASLRGYVYLLEESSFKPPVLISTPNKWSVRWMPQTMAVDTNIPFTGQFYFPFVDGNTHN